ncbi:MAG: O-antigen ligase family protein [Rhodospirillales bacterium]|nr:O-antigen ligase family protein [Rhodospirillales bacterium]MDE2574015.1 O-antigen ligase family protein [Rhodospirillales bacterium]
MSDLYVLLVYLSFFVVGITAPFVISLGYVWGDIFYPQEMSTLVAMFSSSLVMGIGALLAYLAADNRARPRLSMQAFLTILFAAWITLSLTWAVVPGLAYDKWTWAVKAVLVSAFIPFVFRSRVQIEAFLLVVLFALCFHMVPRGLKDIFGGSSYGHNLGLTNNNDLLLESSTLATFSVAMIPIILFMRRHSVLLPKMPWLRNLGATFLVGICIFCAISTFARTALVAFAVVGFFMWLQSRRKIAFAAIALAMVLGFSLATSSSWEARMATTTQYNQEDSALGRILVWKWTLGYVAQHPLGGGFNSYVIDTIAFPSDSGAPGAPGDIVHGKAFHNMYFEVLGEQGIPGLLMFGGIQVLALLYLWRVRRRTRGQPHLLWLHDLSQTLLSALLTVMACANFVGIGYQAIVWYFFVLPVCLREYLHRVERLEKASPMPASAPVRPAMVPFPGVAR